MRECSEPLKGTNCDYSCRGQQGILCLKDRCIFKRINHEDYRKMMQDVKDIDVEKCK